MFVAQIRRLRDTTDLLQALVNNEYARLTGDSPVEAKVADAENDGGSGSGDEGGKSRRHQRLSDAQVTFAEAG